MPPQGRSAPSGRTNRFGPAAFGPEGEAEMQTELFGPAPAKVAQTQGRTAKGRVSGRRSERAEAMRDARDILQWRIGPNPPEWRVERLAEALSGR